MILCCFRLGRPWQYSCADCCSILFPTFTPTDTCEEFLVRCWPASQTFGSCISAASLSVHTVYTTSTSGLVPSSGSSRTTLVSLTKGPSISYMAMGMGWKSRKSHMHVFLMSTYAHFNKILVRFVNFSHSKHLHGKETRRTCSEEKVYRP